MQKYFVKLSLIEELGDDASMGHNLNLTVEGEDEVDAINKAIRRAFSDAQEAGNTLSGIFVGHPRVS